MEETIVKHWKLVHLHSTQEHQQLVGLFDTRRHSPQQELEHRQSPVDTEDGGVVSCCGRDVVSSGRDRGACELGFGLQQSPDFLYIGSATRDIPCSQTSCKEVQVDDPLKSGVTFANITEKCDRRRNWSCGASSGVTALMAHSTSWTVMNSTFIVLQ